jgi:hypothetical protein
MKALSRPNRPSWILLLSGCSTTHFEEGFVFGGLYTRITSYIPPLRTQNIQPTSNFYGLLIGAEGSDLE